MVHDGAKCVGFAALQSGQRVAERSGALHALNGAVGMKVNAVSTLLVTFNVLFRVNEAGLRTKATPLVGMEYGF